MAAEEVCDDHVVQFGADRARYAGLLLELAGRSLPPLSPTGVGMISLRSLLARRVVRILDPSRTLSTRAGARAVAMTLLAGSVGTLLVGMLAVGAREPKARAAEPGPPQAPAPAATLSGQVVGLDGRAIPGAAVLMIEGRSRPGEPGLDGRRGAQFREIGRTTADLDGRFTVTEPKPELGPDGQAVSGVSLYITHPGYGVTPHYNSHALPLVPDDVPITGRLVDLEGRPVAGASVRPTQLFMPWPAEKDREDSPPGWYEINKSIGYGNAYLSTLAPLTTDADGRFRLDGIGRRRLVELEITRADLAVKRVLVQSRAIGRIAEPPPSPTTRQGLDEPGQYGANCTITVEPTRAITGVVRDLQTNRPIAGAIVTASRLDDTTGLMHGDIMARTDAEGRYRLVGLPKCPAPAVAVYPPLDQPYFVTENLKIPFAPGYEPVAFDVALRRAQWITGRVSSIRANQPIKAMIDYYPLIANDHARDYPNFDPAIIHSIPTSSRYQTDAAGRFRIPGLAGQGVVTARTSEGGYRAGFGHEAVAGKFNDSQLPTYSQIDIRNFQAMRPVDAPETGEPVNVDLPLDPGGSVVLRIVDEAGAPVTGADTAGLLPQGANGPHVLDNTSTATVTGLEPGRPRTVLVTHKERRIGAVVELPANGPINGQEQTVVLRPLATVTGRLVGTRVTDKMEVDVELEQAGRINHPDAMRYGNSIGEVVADDAGRFSFNALAAGGTYSLSVRDRSAPPDKEGRMLENFESFPLAPRLTAQPGQVIDLGTFDVTTGKPVATPPAAATRTTTGQVVDPDGRPIAGARVLALASRASTRSLDQIRPEAETRELARTGADLDGRFALTYPEPDPADQSPWMVLTYASAPGYGPVRFADGGRIALPRDDLPVLGRLVDLEGKPVAGASVEVLRLYSPPSATPGAAEPAPGWFDVATRSNVYHPEAFVPRPIAADADGRFRVDGLGRGRLAVLQITGPQLALRQVAVVTRGGGWIADPAPERSDRQATDEPGQHGAACVIAVEPTRVITGVVRDQGTREPIAGVLVASAQINREVSYREGLISDRTDAQGRYRLVGLPKGNDQSLSIYPPRDQPYFVTQRLPVPAGPGFDPVAVDITLKLGIWVTGRVTDVRTAEPVAAAVDYFPFLDNPAARDYANFRTDVVRAGGLLGHARTDAEGRFRIVALPGRGVVTARDRRRGLPGRLRRRGDRGRSRRDQGPAGAVADL